MFRIFSLTQTCVASLSQWEAFSEDGRPVYVRYKHEWLTVRVGPIGGSIAADPVIDMVMGYKMDSWMDWDEVVALTGIEVIDA